MRVRLVVTPGAAALVELAYLEREGEQYNVAKISLDKLDLDVAKVVRGRLVTRPNAIAELACLQEDEETIEEAYEARQEGRGLVRHTVRRGKGRRSTWSSSCAFDCRN